MIFSPAQAALLVRDNGGTDAEAIFLASVVPGESGGNPEIVNRSSTCGPKGERAVGLFQICSFASRGTVAQLQDPAHNAREALKILRSQGERAWTAEPDPDAAEEARQALAGGTHMEVWHPRAKRAPATTAGSSYIGVPWKLVIHTIEAPFDAIYSYGSTYYGSSSWPTATIDSTGISQHYPIDVAARALYNASGGAETNRANVIQCEVMGQAANIRDLPDSTMGHLADWLRWCSEQTGCPLVFPFPFVAYPDSYGENASQRVHGQVWLDSTGIMGHEHADENDHGDPGDFPVERLAAFWSTPDIIPTEEDDMKILRGPAPEGTPQPLYMLSGFTVRHITSWDAYISLIEKKVIPGPAGTWTDVTQAELKEFVLVP